MRNLLFVLTILCIVSCQIEGSFGGLVGYQKKLMKSEVVTLKYAENICEQKYEPSTVFVVNGADLEKCLSGNERTLMHIWKPNCHSDLCIPLTSVEYIADSLNAKLFIVSEYYEEDRMKADYKIATPILGIDCKYYKSSFTKIYLNGFLEDVFQSKKSTIYNFYLFEGNIFKFGTDDYEELYD